MMRSLPVQAYKMAPGAAAPNHYLKRYSVFTCAVSGYPILMPDSTANSTSSSTRNTTIETAQRSAR